MAESLEHGYLTRREQARSEEFRDWLTYHTQPAPPEPTPEGRKRGYMALVEDLAPVYGVDPTLALAVIQHESSFNPRAISPKGAQGLMQLMPATARRFGVTDPFDPADNVRGGLRYLAYLKKLFPGDPEKQLAAYNAGEGAVQAYGGIPPYRETQDYVGRVMATAQGGGQPYVGKEEQAALRGAVGEAMTTMPARGERLEAPAGAAERAITQQPPTGGVPPGTTVQVAPGRIGPERQAMVPVTEEEAAIFEGSYTPPTAVTVEPGRLEEQRQPLSPVLGPGLEPGLEEPLEARLPVRLAQGAVRAAANVLSAVPAFEQFIGIQTPFGNTAQDVALSLEEAASGLEPSGKETTVLDRLAETAGGQVAFFGAGIAGAQAVGFVRAAAPQIVRAVGLTPAAISAVTEAGAEAGQIYEALRPLVGEKEAAKRANTVFWRNVWLLTVTNRLGVFGEAEKPLGRVLAGGALEGVQEVLQYDTQRRAFWVEATHPKAKELQAMGWERVGGRVQQPFEVATATEAAVLGGLMGGGMAGLAGEIGTPREPRRLPGADLLTEAGGLLRSETGGITVPQFPQQPSPPRPVSLAEGAAGLEPSRFRDANGRWRIPLKNMPSEELELQDFIRQQGGIKLTNEELQGELKALISRRETGLSGLQNNVTGRSLQAMAERAEEVGFTATADKTALLDALDLSVNLGRPVYSVAASGYVHLVEDPLTRQLYEELTTLSDTYASRVETQRRGTRPRAEVHTEGAQMLASGQWTVDDILEIQPGTVLDDTTTSALVQGLYRMGTLMQQKAQQFVASGASVGSPEEKSFLQGLALFAEADPSRLGVMAEAGRSLGILNDPLSAFNRFLHQFQPLLAKMGEQSSLQLARRIAALHTPEQVAKTVEKMTQPGVADMLLEVWINGMLSGPKTQMVNFLSNMVTAMWAIPERLVAGMYGSLLPDGKVSMGEAQAMLWGAVQGLREGWQLAAHVVRTGERNPEVGVGTTRQEVRYPKALTAQNVGMDPDTPWGMAFDFWAEYIGLGSGGRLPTRGLMVTDEFFRAVNYRMELAAMAYRKARGTGLSTQEMRDYYATVLTNPDAADMRQAAQSFALIQTFQQDLPYGSWGAQVQGLAGATMQLPGGTTWPVGRALLPFVKTPVNLARWATERTIPGAFYREMWDDLNAGGERRDLAAAKITLGTMTQLAVAGLVSMGVLTGRGPEDKRLREILLRQGWQPYSLRIGNVYVGYDRFDPLGMMLGMTADLVQLSGDHSLDTTGKALAAPFFVLARNITSKTYMRSLAEFFDAVSPQAYEEPGQALEGTARWLRSRLASLVPSSVATVTQLVDPADRELWEWFDGALERTPWTVDNLPLKRDRWGYPKLLGWGFDDTWLTRLGRAVTPFTVDVESVSPIERELEDNAIRLGMPGKTFLPRTAMISEFQGDPTIDPQLTPAQYERYVLYSAANREELRGLGLTYPEDTLRQLTRGAGRRVRETPPAEAMDLRSVLNWLVTTERYLEQSKGPGGGRDEFIREVVVDYQEAAREIMLATDPVLRARYESAIKIRELQRVPEGQKERWQERYERQQQRQQQRYERSLGIGR